MDGGREGEREGEPAGGTEGGLIPVLRWVVIYRLTGGGYNLMWWQLWSGCRAHEMGA